MTVDVNGLLLNCPGKCEVTIIPRLCRSWKETVWHYQENSSLS